MLNKYEKLAGKFNEARSRIKCLVKVTILAINNSSEFVVPEKAITVEYVIDTEKAAWR
jgi:hypothetical protein